jgi:hypothetical protein
VPPLADHHRPSAVAATATSLPGWLARSEVRHHLEPAPDVACKTSAEVAGGVHRDLVHVRRKLHTATPGQCTDPALAVPLATNTLPSAARHHRRDRCQLATSTASPPEPTRTGSSPRTRHHEQVAGNGIERGRVERFRGCAPACGRACCPAQLEHAGEAEGRAGPSHSWPAGSGRYSRPDLSSRVAR